MFSNPCYSVTQSISVLCEYMHFLLWYFLTLVQEAALIAQSLLAFLFIVIYIIK